MLRPSRVHRSCGCRGGLARQRGYRQPLHGFVEELGAEPTGDSGRSVSDPIDEHGIRHQAEQCTGYGVYLLLPWRALGGPLGEPVPERARRGPGRRGGTAGRGLRRGTAARPGAGRRGRRRTRRGRAGRGSGCGCSRRLARAGSRRRRPGRARPRRGTGRRRRRFARTGNASDHVWPSSTLARSLPRRTVVETPPTPNTTSNRPATQNMG